MVQASVTGAIDFAQMQPRDTWWWRKLRWTLEAMTRENVIASLAAQHQHWVGIFSNAALDAESFTNAKENAQQLLRSLLQARAPWDKDAIASDIDTATDLVSDFREMYGYPGEPRYEKMLADMLAAFAKLRKENN